jgi:hypothetical protein
MLGSTGPGYINTVNPQSTQFSSERLEECGIDRVFAVTKTGGSSGRVQFLERGNLTRATRAAASAETVTMTGIGGGTGGVYFAGDIYEIVIVAGERTQDEIRRLLPWLYRHQTRQLLCMGNSIMEGYPAQATPFMQLWQDALPVNIGLSVGWAQSGFTCAQLIAMLDRNVRCQIIPGATTLFFWETTNAIGAGATLQNLKDQHAEVKAWCDSVGIECATATVLRNYNNDGTGSTAWNSWLMANPTLYASSAAHVCDLRGIVALETEGNYLGGVHPNTTAATALAGALNTWARSLP